MLKNIFPSITFILIMSFPAFCEQTETIGIIQIKETKGISRDLETVEIPFQLSKQILKKNPSAHLIITDEQGQYLPMQIIRERNGIQDSSSIFTLVFQVAMLPFETRSFEIKIGASTKSNTTESGLVVTGDGYDLRIENAFYVADLTRSEERPNKNHESGQLRELTIKMGFDQLLFRRNNRMHWAPNFKRFGARYYRTIAQWEQPKQYRVDRGPIMVRTRRADKAPDYAEIELDAVYKFYRGLPYFKFYSKIETIKDIFLTLLRNDEMTMDSLFTHVAFERLSGEIIAVEFKNRYDILSERPIENNAPWLCFYNAEKAYGFGSVRLLYDIRNVWGEPSPTFMPHTKISDGSYGGKYWNRRLIHDHATLVPKGSIYREENAYVVFEIGEDEACGPMKEWAERLRNPLQVRVLEGSY